MRARGGGAEAERCGYRQGKRLRVKSGVNGEGKRGTRNERADTAKQRGNEGGKGGRKPHKRVRGT